MTVKKIRWKKWVDNFLHSTNIYSGIIGIIGLLITLLPLIYVDLKIDSLKWIGFTILGVFLILMLIALQRSFPKYVTPKELLKKEKNGIKVKDIDDIYPPVLKIAFYGPANSGKTTLIDRIREEVKSPKEIKQTMKIEVKISSISGPNLEVECIVLLDGNGSQFGQLFMISEKANLLFILWDHNELNNKPELSNERLEQHKEYLNQLEGKISAHNLEMEDKGNKIIFSRVHFILNKRKLWSELPTDEQKKLKDEFEKTVKTLENKEWVSKVTHSYHSNHESTDIIEIKRVIKDVYQEIEENEKLG